MSNCLSSLQRNKTGWTSKVWRWVMKVLINNEAFYIRVNLAFSFLPVSQAQTESCVFKGHLSIIFPSLFAWLYVKSECCSVMSDSVWPHGLHSLWNSLGQNTGVGSLSLLQGIFPTQESNQGLLHCRQILYQLSYRGSFYMYMKCDCYWPWRVAIGQETPCKPCVTGWCPFTPGIACSRRLSQTLGFLVSGSCCPLPGILFCPGVRAFALGLSFATFQTLPLSFRSFSSFVMSALDASGFLSKKLCPIAPCPTGGIDTGGPSALSLSLPPSLWQADVDLIGMCASVPVPRLPIALLKHPSFPFVSLLNAAHYWRLCWCPTFSMNLTALDSHQSCVSLSLAAPGLAFSWSHSV